MGSPVTEYKRSMKEKAKFYLKRHLKTMEDKGAGPIDHVKAAEAGLTYEMRQGMEDRREKLQEEYEAFEWLYNTLLTLL